MQETDGKKQINKIMDRVFNKTKEQDIIDIYHFFMVNYGYIPFEEFLKMDAHLVGELILRLNKMIKEQNKQGKSSRGRRI